MTTRHEKVVLDLEDNFTAGMVRAAGAAKLLDKELGSLSGSSVRTARDNDAISTSLRKVGAEASTTSSKLRDGSREIDKFSGRLGLLLKAAAVLGPALVPIGGVAVPALAALTAGFGAAAGAAGIALVAFNGMGDALKSIDAYQLEPTTANLEKMRVELDSLGPAGAEFARYLDSLDPVLKDLQNVTREGLFPGVEEGIDGLLKRLPEVRRFLFDMSTAMGDLASDAGSAIGGPKFDAFFAYLESDGVRTLEDFAHATGNVAEGLANMMAAFAPLSSSFSTGMVGMTEAFADWSAGLSASDGFQEFLDYLQRTGPQVADLVGQLALALAAVTEAAAPVGAVLVPALTAVAKVVETIAKSDIGTPLFAGAAAMSALRLATQAWASIAGSSVAGFVAAQGKAAGSIMAVTSAQDRARLSASQMAAAQSAASRTSLAAMGRFAGLAAGIAVASTGAADGIGLSNTAMLGLMGTMLGPLGAAGGAAIGMTLDIAAANDDLEAATRRVDAAMSSGAGSAELAAALAGLDTQITSTAEKFDNFHPFSLDLTDPLKSAKENIDGFIAGTNELVTGANEAAVASREQGNAALEAQQAQERKARADSVSGRVARQTATEIQGLVAAMQEQTSAALGAFDAVTQYGRALDAARAQAKKSEAGINASTEAGRKNRDALSQLAGAWNNQSEAVKNNVGKFREARSAFVQTAAAMGVPIEKARQLAQRLMEIPKSVAVRIDANSDPAIAAANRIKRELASIPRSISTTYYVNQVNAINKGGYEPNPDARGADGMTVPGRRTPYRDKVLAYIAPGEEVISNRHGQADRHRALLKQINANRLAVGGTVGGTASYASVGAGGTPAFAQVGTAAQMAADALFNLTGMSKKELTAREKLLKEELDASKQRLDSMRQEREALAQSVKDLIAGGDLFTVTDAASAVTAGDGASQDYRDLVAQHNADLASGAQVTSNLGTMLSEGRERLALIRKIHHLGVDGAALANLATQPIEVLRELASSRAQANRFERQYNQLQNLGTRGGNYVGGAVFDKRIGELVQETKGLRGDFRQVSQRLERLENKADAKQNTDRVVSAVNKIATGVGNAARSHR